MPINIILVRLTGIESVTHSLGILSLYTKITLHISINMAILIFFYIL